MSQATPSVRLSDRDVNMARPVWAHRVTMALMVGIVAFLFGLMIVTPTHPFSLRFNAFALLSGAAFVACVAAFVMIARLRAQSESIAWFGLFMVGIAIFSGSEVLQRLSATPEAATFWAAAISVGAYMAAPAFYLFALSYTNPEKARRSVVVATLLAAAGMMALFDFRGLLFYNYNLDTTVLTPWGYSVDVSSFGEAGYDVMLLFLIGPLLASMALFWRFRRRTIEPTLRKQSKLFMISVALPMVGSLFTDVLLPLVGIGHVPSMAALFMTGTGMIVAYGILRYRFFTFSPQSVAGSILATMNEAVVGTRPDFTITYANPGAERLLGYTLEQFSSMRLNALLSQEWEPEQLDRAMGQTLGSQNFGTLDSVDLRRADGRTVTVKLSLTRLVEAGRLQGYLVVATDITAIAQATEIIEREVEERTREVRRTKSQLVSSINSLEQGFLMTDTQPEVVTMNWVAHRLFCPEAEHHEVVDCRVVTLASVDDHTKGAMDLAKKVKACMERQRSHVFPNVTFDNRNWRVFLSPIVDAGRSAGCALLWQDITEEWVLARSRDEFFSIASHELRTPLTAIRGNSSMMLEYYANDLKDPQLQAMVHDIYDSSSRLIGIVNDFLDVSRLEQGVMVLHLEELEPAKVLAGVVREMETLFKQRGLYLRLEVDENVTVIADATRVKQIMFNLLGNALRFTETGGVRIEANLERGRLALSVTDTGAGIASELQPLLFHKLQQAGDSLLTRDTSKGTGLGLYIARLLARRMGGELVLSRSVVGEGSTFVLALPLATPARIKRLLRAGRGAAPTAAAGGND